MEYFKEIFQKIISTLLIKQTDPEIDKAKKIIWYSFFCSIILLFFFSWIIFIILTSSTYSVKVPMIEGDNIYIALKKIYKQRLVSHVIPKYSDTQELGAVYNQEPKQGGTVKKGRVISFNVSLGPQNLALPDFRGFTLFELEEYLEKQYPSSEIPFEIENPIYEFNNEVEKGRIFKQIPEDGVPVYNVNKLQYWISNGTKDISAKVIKNYIGRNIEEVSKELANLEIFYTYEYELVNKKSKDMIIIDQSIGEGKLIDEIIEESKILVLKVNKYEYIDGDKIKGTYLLDIPKKPLSYLLEVKIKSGNSKPKLILKKQTKGGVSIPIPYAGKKNAKLLVYYDG
ncbi:MAG: PASTA domain-containing protein, partial [Spirochaetes bacterium]|nr:PASTA domain-containing protein [Spirochaetota bacterium]